MGYKNQEDAKQYRKRYYEKNKDKILHRQNLWRENNRGKDRAKATRYYHKHREKVLKWNVIYSKHKVHALNGVKFIVGCEVCGYRKCLASLQFHHPDPTVKIAKTMTNLGWKQIWNQVLACQVLCANCHIEFHDQNRNT